MVKIGPRHSKQQEELEHEEVTSESFRGRSHYNLPGDPLVIPRDRHNLSRKKIDQDALKVMYRLVNNGFQAYLVGGGVRDLLLGRRPKDFDIGTDARPEQVKKLFRNCRIIGRRFRLAHVYFFGNKIMEVSTFRATMPESDNPLEEQPLRDDNAYGDPQTDALRRDLTINGLFYDLRTFSIIDYVGGIQDLEDRIIRIIGDPDARFHEDPVRMIRVVRHAARTGFRIEQATYDAIVRNADKILLCPKSRVQEEFLREMRHGYALESFRLMHEMGLLKHVAPLIDDELRSRPIDAWHHLELVLKEADSIARSGIELMPSILFPAMAMGVIPPIQLDTHAEVIGGIPTSEAWNVSPLFSFYSHDFAVPTKLPKIEFNKLMQFLRNGHLRHIIQKIFHPMGVSKKECEKMEQLLLLRVLMFEGYYGFVKVGALERRAGFSEALMLLRLTVKEEYAQNCLDYWQGRECEVEAGDEHVSKNRRRRRRRKSDSAGQDENQSEENA